MYCSVNSVYDVKHPTEGASVLTVVLGFVPARFLFKSLHLLDIRLPHKFFSFLFSNRLAGKMKRIHSNTHESLHCEEIHAQFRRS